LLSQPCTFDIHEEESTLGVDINMLGVECQQTQTNRTQEKGKKRHNPQTDLTGVAAKHEECLRILAESNIKLANAVLTHAAKRKKKACQCSIAIEIPIILFSIYV
jgi:hypothetical protein